MNYKDKNLAVARVVGLAALLRTIKCRVADSIGSPKWLIAALEDGIERADLLIDPLIEFRGEYRFHDEEGEKCTNSANAV